MAKVKITASIAGGDADGLGVGDVAVIPDQLAENDAGTGWVQSGVAEYYDGSEEVKKTIEYETTSDESEGGEVETTTDQYDEWDLQTSPKDYVDRYGDEEDVSETVENRLELARKLIEE